MYQTLRADKIISTVTTLTERVRERFPGSGLAKVSADLCSLSRQTSERIEYVSRPLWGLRFILALVLVAVMALLTGLVALALNLKGSEQLTDTMQGLEAAVNLTIVLGGAAFFIVTLETRWKRDRALKELHKIRSIVHVIDMHQLTKDPSSDRPATVTVEGGADAQRTLSSFELMRYLDYCSELLSLTAKCAALYAEKLSDAVVVDTVGDIERLTSSLSSNIWQKITIINSFEGRDMPLPVPGPPTTPSS